LQAGVSPRGIVGYEVEEQTHLSVAACVAAGSATCGFGLRMAAEHFGLEFVPLVTEQYFLVCRKPMLETMEMQAVLDVLRSDEFALTVRAAPGYGAERSGEIVSLRKTLPWYK
jgi:putative molybdopterin biosynthesis protein